MFDDKQILFFKFCDLSSIVLVMDIVFFSEKGPRPVAICIIFYNIIFYNIIFYNIIFYNIIFYNISLLLLQVFKTNHNSIIFNIIDYLFFSIL